MDFGATLIKLRKEKNWSKTDLAEKTGVSRVIIGRYERNEALPSIEVAKNIADAFKISMDQLIGEGQNMNFDKKTLARLQELELLEPEKKKTLFDLIDTYIIDAKTRQAYAS